jgi:thiamine-phosphate diphosphorylase
MSMFKLIAVTDQASCPENFWTQLQLLAASEIDVLIFRAKELPPQEYYRQASQVQKICRTHQLPLILHTYQDICRRLDTYGLQVSYQQLLCQPQLRAQVQCLGVSIHNADEAVRAADLGADYLLAGHIFATNCKQGLPGRGLDFLSAVCAATSLQVYAIGGISCQYRTDQKNRRRRRLSDEQPDDLPKTSSTGAKTAAGFTLVPHKQKIPLLS